MRSLKVLRSRMLRNRMHSRTIRTMGRPDKAHNKTMVL